MRHLALVLTLCVGVGCGDDDLPRPDSSPRGGDNDDNQPPDGSTFECLPNGSAPEPLSSGAYWQYAANGAICLNDPFDPLGSGIGCVNPGVWDRPTAGSQFRGDSIGKAALDCACAWWLGSGQPGEYTGGCDLAVATGLDLCADAPYGRTFVVYESPFGARCQGF